MIFAPPWSGSEVLTPNGTPGVWGGGVIPPPLFLTVHFPPPLGYPETAVVAGGISWSHWGVAGWDLARFEALIMGFPSIYTFLGPFCTWVSPWDPQFGSQLPPVCRRHKFWIGSGDVSYGGECMAQRTFLRSLYGLETPITPKLTSQSQMIPNGPFLCASCCRERAFFLTSVPCPGMC